MKTILIAGGSGLVGQRIVQLLDPKKYEVHILSRIIRPSSANVKYFLWDVNKGFIDGEALQADYFINLTGAGIADKRWSAKRKQELIDSRVKSTSLIYNAMKQEGWRFKACVNASAIGYYGDRADEELTTASAAGEGFLSECCKLWEMASKQLEEVSAVNHILRVGIVLSTQGGALPKILMTQGVKMYNYFGRGDQYYSWIHIDDLSRMFLSLLNHRPSGIFNGVSPTPLTNKAFTHAVSDGAGGGLVLPAPSIALRLLLGEMADVVLNSNRVLPEGVGNINGFEYQHPDLEPAIADLIARNV